MNYDKTFPSSRLLVWLANGRVFHHDEPVFTMAKIRDGSTYLDNHLCANDYYAEGESVAGQWQGQLATRLGLAEGQAIQAGDTAFRMLRENVNPATGEKLTQRNATAAAVKMLCHARRIGRLPSTCCTNGKTTGGYVPRWIRQFARAGAMERTLPAVPAAPERSRMVVRTKTPVAVRTRAHTRGPDLDLSR